MPNASPWICHLCKDVESLDKEIFTGDLTEAGKMPKYWNFGILTKPNLIDIRLFGLVIDLDPSEPKLRYSVLIVWSSSLEWNLAFLLQCNQLDSFLARFWMNSKNALQKCFAKIVTLHQQN